MVLHKCLQLRLSEHSAAAGQCDACLLERLGSRHEHCVSKARAAGVCEDSRSGQGLTHGACLAGPVLAEAGEIGVVEGCKGAQHSMAQHGGSTG
jgi:hypothetical protein